MFVFQQGASNAEKFDYVSTLWLLVQSFPAVPDTLMPTGHELHEQTGGERVRGFQQRHVSQAARRHTRRLAPDLTRRV